MVRAPYGATPVPISNREVLLAALKEGLRVDGRAAYDVRQWRFEFGAARGHVEVSLGKTKYAFTPAMGLGVLAKAQATHSRGGRAASASGPLLLYRVLARTSCEVARPLPDRPTDGLLMVNTEFSPMASTAFDTPRCVSGRGAGTAMPTLGLQTDPRPSAPPAAAFSGQAHGRCGARGPRH